MRYLPCLLNMLLACLWTGSSLVAATSPNFLIILADDCTYNDLPIYGGRNARTPNLDRLASQGLIFDRAYLTSAMCQPCRAELYTGQFPMRNGCTWNHSASRPETKSLPHYLRPMGYRVGLAGKVHVQPEGAFPFDKVEGFDPNCVRNPTRPHRLDSLRDYFNRDTQKPFCLVAALVEPHVPWVMGDASAYPPNEIQLPPNIADTQRTREDFSRYLAEITYMDRQVGEILQALEDSGQAGNTLVLFSSEQGAQFPGCKWTNWDTGLHTALIARWPGLVPAGSRTEAIVHYADVLPTLMDAAGSPITANSAVWDGSSFLKVLLGQTNRFRQFAYGMHNNVPEGPPYPIRSVTDGVYHYIRNLAPEEIYIEKHLMGADGDGDLNNPYWATWVWSAWNNEPVYELVKRYTRRPAEELYHLPSDRFELNNLVEDVNHVHAKERLRRALGLWMKQQGDPGAPQDTIQALLASRDGRHLYGPKDASTSD